MTAPTPDNFDRTVNSVLAELRSVAEKMKLEYRYTYNAGHNRTVGENAASARHGHSDPTGSIVIAKGPLRKACEEAHKMVAEAPNLWKSSLGKLTMHGPAEHGGSVGTPLRFPRTATRDELREAREAKERRERRGEGYGEA